jgi:uncharacterized protein YdeI (YjbR/CyaY-like superfamily)
MSTIDKNELEILSFRTQEEFEKWLSKNHHKSAGIWLRFFKKGSGEKMMSYDEALDDAICYGWIDGQLQKYDDKSWIRRFTPRGPKSIWSKKNTAHAERLITDGKMNLSGLAQIEKAKADGRWVKAYDSPSKMEIPDDFIKAVSANKKALKFFESLNKANRYSIAWRLQTAKNPATREKRMKIILGMLAKGQKFH